MKITAKAKGLVLSALVMFFGFLSAHAQTAQLVGGSNLINQTQANQFAVWLNEGNIRLTKIFNKTDGDGKDGEDFHAVVDGQGRTATFMRVNAHPGQYLVGGYNPRSWTSINDYHLTPNNADRKAFLFNLTSNFVQRQKLHFFICTTGNNDPGLFQTYNHEELGPVFGQGADIWVNNNLESGTMWNYSYGTNCHSNNILNVNYPLLQNVDFTAFEVFKVALAPTAASVFVSGRVLTASGNGIRNVSVTLTDSQGNAHPALSSAFGYYRFDNIPAGETVIIGVRAKRYTFSQPSQVLNVLEDVGNVNFVADDSSSQAVNPSRQLSFRER